MNVTCAILAGGRSARMGKDKATIEVCNKPLIQQVYEKARLIFKKILIVSSIHEHFPGIDTPIVKDIFPLRSSMVGIASALLSADTPYVFALACDGHHNSPYPVWLGSLARCVRSIMSFCHAHPYWTSTPQDYSYSSLFICQEGPGTSGLYEWRCISVYQHQCRRGFVSC